MLRIEIRLKELGNAISSVTAGRHNPVSMVVGGLARALERAALEGLCSKRVFKNPSNQITTTMKFISKARFARLWLMISLTALCVFSFSSLSFAVTIGDHYGGGVVFYVDASGQQGLIAAETDISKSHTDMWGDTFGAKGFLFRWSTGEFKNATAPDYANRAIDTGRAIGTGRSNTKKFSVNILHCNTQTAPLQ